ncbi:hypothetical protein JOC86_001230 [Bacillus pakistanensis]|uniref:LysM domain-containing protein n=1 Tax=Rossellomorea pakistanensis TaxID=992288 RepID=A0ABS2NA23_9BACI|nr:LysM peptidoglycan-binding domain-containing protein [Bacillus pakistanensis]MBM7584693.1 hypothetical protein [Bacillus pakistanensis]
MKRAFYFLLVLIVLYSVYYDLNTGTLPKSSTIATTGQAQESNASMESDDNKSLTIKVKPGDTVLSLVEEHRQGSSEVAIDQIIKDFEELNDGLNPEDIQIGKTYYFPVYP